MRSRRNKFLFASSYKPSFLMIALGFLAGFPFFIYIMFLKYTIRFVWLNSLPTSGEKNLYFTWHTYGFCTVPLMTNKKFNDAFLLGHQRLIAFMHSVPGYISGGSFYHYFRKKGEDNTNQLREFFERENQILIFTDSGGPYKKMKPGTIRTAKELKLNLIPVALYSSRQWTTGTKKYQQLFPLPFSTVSVRFGRPMDLSKSTEELQRECEQVLNRLLSQAPLN